mmetsp:Transcript_7882/g.22690  ORF Transcript_7882/g.22690 Transcript_7882/m.22690 type:complete len:203 (+) Transcript_7882:130-738(+)
MALLQSCGNQRLRTHCFQLCSAPRQAPPCRAQPAGRVQTADGGHVGRRTNLNRSSRGPPTAATATTRATRLYVTPLAGLHRPQPPSRRPTQQKRRRAPRAHHVFRAALPLDVRATSPGQSFASNYRPLPAAAQPFHRRVVRSRAFAGPPPCPSRRASSSSSLTATPGSPTLSVRPRRQDPPSLALEHVSCLAVRGKRVFSRP